MRTHLLPVIALLLVALAGPALSVDGVLEINHTCAVQTGCFSGDAPGYPVTIDGSAGRSYLLTSDLSSLTFPGGPQAATFIEISADHVTLDLGGFGISCANVIGGKCSGAGSGVSAPDIPPIGTSVKNGSITGMGTYGVFLGEQAEVLRLRVHRNGLDGIFAGLGSTVSGSTAHQNLGNGISVSEGSTASGNVAYLNGVIGIFAGPGSTVSGNTTYRNVADGISAVLGSTISGNTSRENGLDGIVAGSGCTVSGNTAHVNGDDGIFASSGSTVSGNTVSRNTGFGLRFLDATAAYRGNTIDGNTAGTVSLGINAGGNVCNGSLTCP